VSRLRYQIAAPWLIARRLINSFRVRPPASAFRILMLHDVPEEQCNAFERLVADLKKTRKILSPEEAEKLLDGVAPDQPATDWGRLPVLISFDDGFQSNHVLAADILAGHGVKALFFVCPELVDLEGEAQAQAIAANIFRGQIDWRQLPQDQRLMTWSELAELRAMGHTIGAHGMGHRRLAGLAGDALGREILGAGARIEEELQAPADWYAYAFGNIASINRAALAAIALHYKYCRSGIRGVNSEATGRYALLADQIEADLPGTYLDLVLEGGLDGRYRQPAGQLSRMLE
jgi:peptidoglycan/xylan/chitin deacetylase (PgdA/CDA1 family)